MSHPEWFAFLVCALLGGIVAGVKMACDKLDRVVQLLETVSNQQGEANSSLRSMEHDSNIIRERTPRR